MDLGGVGNSAVGDCGRGSTCESKKGDGGVLHLDGGIIYLKVIKRVSCLWRVEVEDCGVNECK